MPNSNRKKKLLVFLSHANEDKPIIRELCQRLKDEGFDPWLDEERILPGQDWQLEIEQALRKSDAILVSFSKKSLVKEGYIQREYKKALDYQKEKPEGTIFVIPVRLDTCDIPFFLRELQCVDYPSGYEKLLKSLNVRVGVAYEKKRKNAINDKGKEDYKKVQIVLDGSFEEFNETRREDLVSVLASILKIDSKDIRILRVYSGSIVVEVEIPRIAANRLIEFVTNGDFRLKAKGILSVQIGNEEPVLLYSMYPTNNVLKKPSGQPERLPFIFGRPVRGKEFIGRENEIASILNRVRNGESTAIIGQPHVGKTSLLLKLTETEVNDDYLVGVETIFQYIDLHPVEPDYSPSIFWSEATAKLGFSQSKKLVELHSKAIETNFERHALESVFDFMGKNNLRLVLLLDEFETLFRRSKFKDLSFFPLVRSLASRTGGLSIVIASRLRLAQINEMGRKFLDLGSPFFNYMIENRLKPFADNEISILLERGEIPFSDIEKRFIRNVAGRNPFLLQTLAQAVVENRGEANLRLAAEEFYEQVSSYYDELWLNLSEKERTVALILAIIDIEGYATGRNYSFGEIEDVTEFDAELKRLENYGLVARTSSGAQLDFEHALVWRGERWAISGKGFTWWARDYVVAQNRLTPSFNEWLETREKKKFLTNEMNQQLTTSLRSLPQWAMQGVSGLAEALLKNIT